jgi:hypothetical protein
MSLKNSVTQSEDNLQGKVWTRLWTEYPFLRRRVWHVANQRADRKEASRVQAMGVLSGVWDLHMYFKKQYVIFECKTKDGRLSRDRIVKGRKIFGQQEWGEIMSEEGAWCYVFRSEEEFFTQLHEVFFRLNFVIPK